jgi:hypothetical protein
MALIIRARRGALSRAGTQRAAKPPEIRRGYFIAVAANPGGPRRVCHGGDSDEAAGERAAAGQTTADRRARAQQRSHENFLLAERQIRSKAFACKSTPSHKEALEWAAKTASACRCAVEVWEFMPDPETDEMLRQADSRR